MFNVAPNYFKLERSRYNRVPMAPLGVLVQTRQSILKRLPKKGALLPIRERLALVAGEVRQLLIRRGEQEAQTSDLNRRQIDAQADRLWRAIHDILESLDALGPDAPRAQKARHLLNRYLDDMSFLMLPYSEQYLAMEVKLKRLEKNGEVKLLGEVVGLEFYPALVDIMGPYKAMVDVAVDGEEPNESLVEPRRVLAATMSQTAMAVLGMVDATSEKSVAAALKILRPLDVLRSQQKRKGGEVEVLEPDEDTEVEDTELNETPEA